MNNFNEKNIYLTKNSIYGKFDLKNSSKTRLVQGYAYEYSLMVILCKLG